MLDEPQNINLIAIQHNNTKRSKAQFACLYAGFHDKNLKHAALIFATGKVICIGARTPAVACLGLYNTRNFIRSRAAYDVPSIDNTVFTVTCPYGIDIVNLHLDNRELTNFDPFRFTGCYYAPEVSAHVRRQPVCSNAFHTGKFTILATKRLDDAVSFASKFLTFLEPYARPGGYQPGKDSAGRQMKVRKWLQEQLVAEKERRGVEGLSGNNPKRQKVEEETVDFVQQLASASGAELDGLMELLAADAIRY